MLLGQYSGRELGYAEITSSFSTTSATDQAITSLSLTFEATGRPILVEMWAFAVTMSTLSSIGVVTLKESSTVITLGGIYGGANVPALDGRPYRLARRLTPSSGSHTYQGYIHSNGSATCTYSAAAGGAVGAPAFIQVIEL